MKLYRTTGDGAEGGRVLFTWQGTQADAKAARVAMQVDGLKDVKTEDVDVPTDKPGLLAWLNANVAGE